MKQIVFALCCFLLLASIDTGAGEQDVPLLSDYAWGFPISVGKESSFYSIELPLKVNQSVSDPELRDAGVYNAAGEPVIRVFQQTSDDVDRTEHLKPLPMIPLFENSERSADDVRLLFERNGDKTRVEFNTDGLQPPQESDRLAAYIVDTRQLKQSIEALEFSWNPIDSGFIGRIMVEGSNNLHDWSDIGGGAVADLSENDASVIQRRVKVRKTSLDYLRIRWEDMPEQWSLSGVNGFYVTGVTTIVRKSVTLDSSHEDPNDHGQVFELGGAPMIDRLRVMLSQPNTVISATIYYWSEGQQRWVRVTTGSHHRIGRGNAVVTSSAIRMNKARTSRVKVVVTRGLPDTPMQMEVGWRPDSLIFLAQGDAPFTLAAGRAADAANSFPQHRLFGDRSIVGLSTGSGRVAVASLGSRYRLGGTSELTVERPVNWRQLALWIGLILGVAFVGFMATKVIRDLKAE